MARGRTNPLADSSLTLDEFTDATYNSIFRAVEGSCPGISFRGAVIFGFVWWPDTVRCVLKSLAAPTTAGSVLNYALLLLLLCFTASSSGGAQTLEITTDLDVPISSVQRVNVGEHVRLRARLLPAGTTASTLVWVVTGAHLKDWVTKDAEPLPMALADYRGQNIHFLWRDVTGPFSPNIVQVIALVGSTALVAAATFEVERAPKAEKFFSDDLLMENHGNWHSVWSFSATSTRRGDLFLAWHRSQLEYFNAWRSYFGYPQVPNWNPTQAWMLGGLSSQRLHPSNAPAPAAGFSQRHDLITLSLNGAALNTASEGEFDLVTQAEGRGTTPQFITAGSRLRLETVRAILGLADAAPYSRDGLASDPSWWQPNTGQTATDPWFASGCPAFATPFSSTQSSSCSVSNKRSLSNYTLRQLGESIESGRYATDFQLNYHALGHIAASEDMGDPRTSMRDPIFWGWHQHIDDILRRWQQTQGVEAGPPLGVYTKPVFSADWSRVRVAFSHRILNDLARAGNVTVNGSSATAFSDVSFDGVGYILEFSGFTVPPSGPVELVVRRELNNTIRTNSTQPRPRPTMIMSTFGNILTPAVNRYIYSKP